MDYYGQDYGAALAILGPLMAFYAVVGIFYLVVMWKIYAKAGKPGWAAIVPIYNLVVMLEMVGRPIWWILLLLVPFVNIVVGIMLLLDLGKVFGKSTGWSVGLLIFFGFIGLPILAFGKDEYRPREQAS